MYSITPGSVMGRCGIAAQADKADQGFIDVMQRTAAAAGWHSAHSGGNRRNGLHHITTLRAVPQSVVHQYQR